MQSKRTRQVTTPWIKHLKTPADREHMQKNVQARKDDPVFKRLVDILEERLVVLEAQELGEVDSPGWAYKQAFFVGRKKELKDTLNLLTQ